MRGFRRCAGGLVPHLGILAPKLVTHEQQRANNRMAIYLSLPVVVHVTVVLHVGDLRDHGVEDGPARAVLDIDRAEQALGEELVEVVVGVVAVLATHLLLLRCSSSRRSTVRRLALRSPVAVGVSSSCFILRSFSLVSSSLSRFFRARSVFAARSFWALVFLRLDLLSWAR